jgi:hypothetical protein
MAPVFTRVAMENKLITYTLERDGEVFVVEHVPAQVSKETGEAFFSPETVDRLQAIIAGKSVPVRRIEAPVYEFAA